MPEASLSRLQHWMKSVVTGPGDLPDKLHAATIEHGLGAADVIAAKRGLSAEVRVGIYARGYVMRLLDCMRADFPVLRAFIGDAVFDAFARAYIIERPPSSPSLFDLGAAFPRFLEETRPAADGELSALLALPAEIARLERARGEAARAAGVEDDPPDDAPSPFAWLAGEVHAAPSLRLLELSFPLADFVKRIEAGERPEPPAPRRSFVAVGRSAYRVHIAELEPWQYAFLRACEQRTGVHAAAEDVAAELTLWLPVAMSRGYVRASVTRE